MGSIVRRLQTLEDSLREQATAEVRLAWRRLSSREVALVLAPANFGRDPTPEEAEVAAAFQEVVPEDLIARAIGYHENLTDEEVSRRLREVTDPVLEGRQDQVLEHLQSINREETT